MSLNKVMLIGNVGKDPEVRYLDGNSQTNGATKVASFPLATTERYRDRNNELRESTEWHNIVAWRNSADIAEKYIHKGSQIFIEGKLRSRSWTDQAGVKKYTTEVVVDTLQLLGKRPEGQGGEAPYQQAAAQQPSYQQPAGFQPRANAAAPQHTPQAAALIDITVDDSTDDLPF